MTREEAINAIKEHIDTYPIIVEIEALEMAIEALEQEPKTDTWSIKDVANTLAKHGIIAEQEPCEDAVSRQAVLDLIADFDLSMGQVVKGIHALPPVNPQKIGHWIDMGSGQECSECREIQYGYDSFRYFCANCGAKMIEPQESEDKK